MVFTHRKVPLSTRFTYTRISVPVASDSSVWFPDCLPPVSPEQPTALQKPPASCCTGCSRLYPPCSILGGLGTPPASLQCSLRPLLAFSPGPHPPRLMVGVLVPPQATGRRDQRSFPMQPPPALAGVPRKHTHCGFPSQAGMDVLVSAIGEGETHGQQFHLPPTDPH